MDNGLIFPYPCVCARGESVILTTHNPRGVVFDVFTWCVRGA